MKRLFFATFKIHVKLLKIFSWRPVEHIVEDVAYLTWNCVIITGTVTVSRDLQSVIFLSNQKAPPQCLTHHPEAHCICPPERSLHSDVWRAFRGRRRLRMSHPGSDPRLAHFSNVRGLMLLGGGDTRLSDATLEHLSSQEWRRITRLFTRSKEQRSPNCDEKNIVKQTPSPPLKL